MRYQPTNQPTDRPTDTASYRGALSHLKKTRQGIMFKETLKTNSPIHRVGKMGCTIAQIIIRKTLILARIQILRLETLMSVAASKRLFFSLSFGFPLLPFVLFCFPFTPILMTKYRVITLLVMTPISGDKHIKFSAVHKNKPFFVDIVVIDIVVVVVLIVPSSSSSSTLRRHRRRRRRCPRHYRRTCRHCRLRENDIYG